jgi:hypothetical protein
MPLIGLEINDSGLLAAGGENPVKLLDLDGQAKESPGFALLQKKGLLVGRPAESKAHLFPSQILNRFWHQLSTESLEQSGKHLPRNHAEVVYHHLASIWRQLQSRADEVVLAVPSFYEHAQLGLILGVAQELGMPVKGFLPLSLAASSRRCPDKMLLYLDIYLHRIEVVYLEQGQQLTIRDSASTADQGLIHLYRQWVDAIAEQFVRTTRFDPLHQAASEQELYDRLPGVLAHLVHHPSMTLEVASGSRPYSITLERDLITRKAESVYGEIIRLIERMRTKRGQGQTPLVLQLSHRLTRLPGCNQMLAAALKDAEIIELKPGAGAFGVLDIWHRLEALHDSRGISYFTSRPWQRPPQAQDPVPANEKATQTRPTHVLYRSLAYPITDKPLTIGRAGDIGRPDVPIDAGTAGVAGRHCTIELQGREVVLYNHSIHGTFVDDVRIHKQTVLKLGQIIRVGSPGEKLELIACLGRDET